MERESNKSNQASEHQVLMAAISEDTGAVQRELSRMSHRAPAGLRVVSTLGAPTDIHTNQN